MRVLLDECIGWRLSRDLAEHQVPEYSENCVFGVSNGVHR